MIDQLSNLNVENMGGQAAPEVKLSPLWERALESYHEDLAGDEDFRKILETGSLEELLADDQVLQPVGSQGRQALDTMTRLKPTFKLLNDFSVVLAMSLGAGTAVTALVWGSIRMILTVNCPFPILPRYLPNQFELRLTIM